MPVRPVPVCPAQVVPLVLEQLGRVVAYDSATSFLGEYWTRDLRNRVEYVDHEGRLYAVTARAGVARLHDLATELGVDRIDILHAHDLDVWVFG